jgi:hypothetical protein
VNTEILVRRSRETSRSAIRPVVTSGLPGSMVPKERTP